MIRIIAVYIVLSCLCFSVSAAQVSSDDVLTLHEALIRADSMSVQAIVAEARVQESIARMGQARSSLLPQISGNAQILRQTQDLRTTGMNIPGMDPEVGPFNSFDARARVSQVIFDASAFNRLKAALRGRDLSRAEQRKAKEDVLALVATLYVQAVRAEEHKKSAKFFLARDRKTYQLAKVKLNEGTGSSVERDKARADYVQSRYLYRAAVRQSVQSTLDLRAALKIQPGTSLRLDGASIPLVFEDVPEAADGLTPHMKVATGQVSVQQAQLAAARSGYWPVITALADYGRAGRTGDQSSYTYLLGLKATIPIWEGGSRQAKVDEERAKLAQVEAQLDDIAIREDANYILSKERIREAKSYLIAQRQALTLAQNQYNVAVERARSGIGHHLDVITAKARMAYIQDEQSEAEAQLWLAKIGLVHAIGQMPALIKTGQ